MHAHTHTCTHPPTHTHTLTHTHTHTLTHTHTHTHTHAHAPNYTHTHTLSHPVQTDNDYNFLKGNPSWPVHCWWWPRHWGSLEAGLAASVLQQQCQWNIRSCPRPPCPTPAENNNNNNNNSYIALYPVKIYKFAALYIINIKIRLTIKNTINAYINI